jgi:enamine deaminase RidA (YjgF/YER057c/UK114 family)
MSAAVISGNLLFVSGQVALDHHNELVGENDFRLQAVQCFENLEAVLSRAGTGLDHVVQVTAFICRREDLADYLDVRARTFSASPPATTTVVADLLDPRFLIEVQAVAHVPAVE